MLTEQDNKHIFKVIGTFCLFWGIFEITVGLAQK